ncbi:MAG: chorismate synthase [Candidatus Riflebacteria bacterium]|nr:chorismate synthase [Candidatus Riflebacteria bacterium]
MSNTFGNLFKVTTWGESHGPALGAVVDGCPAQLAIVDEDIEERLALDVPDHELGTPRGEKNRFQILSGIFQGLTLGTPISIIIWNNDAKPGAYLDGRDTLRPGHADFTWLKRFGYTDWRGGSRASGRECISRLASGAISLKLLAKYGVSFHSKIVRLAGMKITDEESMQKARERALEIGKSGNSSGGVIELEIKGIPPGLGSPVFLKLTADLSASLFSIGGVKGVEFGAGFEAADMRGNDFNDPFFIDENHKISLETNNCGGTLGGISTGSPLVIRVAIKPTPTIQIPQKTVNVRENKEQEVKYSGRFDMNFAPRVLPIAESMASFVIVNHMMASGLISPTKID